MSAKSTDRWAAIDLGIDTVRLLVGRVRESDDGLVVRHLDARMRLVDLGGGLEEGSRRVENTASFVSAVARYVRVAERASAALLVAAGEGFRQLPAAEALLISLERELGLAVRPLSVSREAELAFAAARGALEPRYSQLVVDLRGATTHVSLTAGRALDYRLSLPLGAASLAASLPGDPPSPLEWSMEAVRIGGLLAALPEARPMQAVVTGGVAHAITGLDGVKGEARPVRLSFADLDRLSDELLRTSTRKIARRTGDDPRRVALLGPGSLILAAILRRFGLERCVVIPQGLRDGIILAAATQGEAWWHDDAGTPPGSERTMRVVDGAAEPAEGNGLHAPAHDSTTVLGRPSPAGDA